MFLGAGRVCLRPEADDKPGEGGTKDVGGRLCKRKLAGLGSTRWLPAPANPMHMGCSHPICVPSASHPPSIQVPNQLQHPRFQHINRYCSLCLSRSLLSSHLPTIKGRFISIHRTTPTPCRLHCHHSSLYRVAIPGSRPDPRTQPDTSAEPSRTIQRIGSGT